MSTADGGRLEYGRAAVTFTRTPEWVLLSGVSPQAYMLYGALLAHVNHARGDGVAWPGTAALAEILGFNRRQSVARYIDELESIGAIDVDRNPRSTRRGYVYRIHEVPPAIHNGHETLGAWHAARHKRIAAGRAPTDAVGDVGADARADAATDAAADTNQTNPTQTNGTRRSTPPGEDDVTSSRRKHVSDQMRFFKPKGFDRMDDVRIAGALPGVFIKIMERHQLDPHTQGVHEIGNWTKKCFDNGYTRNEVWRTFQTIVRQAVAGERHEWLVKWGEAA